MKKLFLLGTAILTLTACKTKTVTDTQSGEITTTTVKAFTPKASLVNTFKRDFPNSTRAVWTRNDTRNFVTFYNEGRYPSEATYGYDGTLLDNKMGIDPNKLPLTSKSFLNTKYPQNTIKNAYLVRMGKTNQKYLVQLNGTEDAVFDLDGNFIAYKE